MRGALKVNMLRCFLCSLYSDLTSRRLVKYYLWLWSGILLLFTMKTPGGFKAEDIFGPSPSSSSSRTPSTPVGGVGKGKKCDNDDLRMIKIDASMCRGKLRGNDVVCTKPKASCVKNHQGDGIFKLGVRKTMLMVRRNATSAYSSLALQPELFDEYCLIHILSLRYSIDDWTSIIYCNDWGISSFLRVSHD